MEKKFIVTTIDGVPHLCRTDFGVGDTIFRWDMGTIYGHQYIKSHINGLWIIAQHLPSLSTGYIDTAGNDDDMKYWAKMVGKIREEFAGHVRFGQVIEEDKWCMVDDEVEIIF